MIISVAELLSFLEFVFKFMPLLLNVFLFNKTCPILPNVYRIFLKIWHPLFFGTLSLKCVLNLQISASALVLRHSKPTARCEKSCTSLKRAVDAFLYKTHARRHTSNYSALMELLPQLLPNNYWASKSEIIFLSNF